MTEQTKYPAKPKSEERLSASEIAAIYFEVFGYSPESCRHLNWMDHLRFARAIEAAVRRQTANEIAGWQMGAAVEARRVDELTEELAEVYKQNTALISDLKNAMDTVQDVLKHVVASAGGPKP